jgi:hypothetical protein
MPPADPIGSIKCPWCGRAGELHRSEERTKLNPDDSTPRPAYPKKLFVKCPAVTGYRGCGTTLANSADAQARMLELGHVFGASGRDERPDPKPVPVHPVAAPALPAIVPQRFGFWGSSR